MIRTAALEKAAGARSLTGWPSTAEGPLEIPDFLEAGRAREILGELESAGEWVRQWQILEPGAGGRIRSVDEATFRSTATRSSETEPFWFCAVRTLGTAALQRLPAAAALLAELTDGAFLPALSEKFGFAVAPASGVNGARYEQGDFLRAHQDNFPGWIGSLIIYLSRLDWAEDSGGRLGFRGADGASYTHPVHNSACVIPITDLNYHWVEPVSSPSFSRLSLNLHLCRA